LKHSSNGLTRLEELVPPGLTAGGGLKPLVLGSYDQIIRFPPASPPGAD